MSVTRRSVLGLVALGVLVAVAGCSTRSGDAGGAGDIPDNQAFVDYRPASGVFVVRVPEGWARTDTATEVLFADKLNSIRIEESTRAAAPDLASGRADLQALAGSRGFTPGDVSMVTGNAGEALLVTYRADASADPVTGKVVNDDVSRYQFFHAGHLVTVTLAGPHGADNVDPWRTVTDSLRWL
ncbi:lipoprotein [Longispora fulva]|uniref:Lipoprotein n=1 Tax=Longispora fulva TaxID=619741 RepID=A0A8J7GE84_9ACTN|nr:hypothetical protein [Longispora fulva]MBG6136250.1 hypothetical protein [Longispora fulva]GIG63432.1 lipoprotein [Longispora fulva]